MIRLGEERAIISPAPFMGRRQRLKDAEIAPMLQRARRFACVFDKHADVHGIGHGLRLVSAFYGYLVRVPHLCKGCPFLRLVAALSAPCPSAAQAQFRCAGVWFL